MNEAETTFSVSAFHILAHGGNRKGSAAVS